VPLVTSASSVPTWAANLAAVTPVISPSFFHSTSRQENGKAGMFRHSRRESFHDGRQHICYEGHLERRETVLSRLFPSIRRQVGAYADHSMFAIKFAPVEATEVAFAHIPNVRFEGAVFTRTRCRPA